MTSLAKPTMSYLSGEDYPSSVNQQGILDASGSRISLPGQDYYDTVSDYLLPDDSDPAVTGINGSDSDYWQGNYSGDYYSDYEGGNRTGNWSDEIIDPLTYEFK